LTALPVVSVVISCRNRATLLWDCFLGLGAQTLPRERLEVVLMDNVSTDDLAEVVRSGAEGRARSALVRPDGVVDLPLAQAIPAAGMTLEERRARLNERYARKVGGVTVTAWLSQIAPRSSSSGRCARPGRFPPRPRARCRRRSPRPAGRCRPARWIRSGCSISTPSAGRACGR
jgi:glycosyltransferase involved in cell wall biosynthesis